MMTAVEQTDTMWSGASCPKCASGVQIAFGPYGFVSTCPGCGRQEHLDDLLEPLDL